MHRMRDPFTTGYPQKKTCSPACSKTRQRKQARQANQARRASQHHLIHEVTCHHCGATSKTDRPGQKYCSRACRNADNVTSGRQARATAKAGEVSKRRAKPKPIGPKPAPRDLRSPLTKALDEKDNEAIISAIEARSTKAGECWEWNGRQKDGYAILTYRGKQLAAYRVALEAKLGARLGDQAAHHMCANTICVNPNHLQPISHRENLAEMLERKFYRSRIAKLEAALAEADPNHHLLREISILDPH